MNQLQGLQSTDSLSPYAKNSLLYLSLCSKISAKFPYHHEITESDSFLIIYTISGDGQISALHDSVSLSKNTILFFPLVQNHTVQLQCIKEWDFYILVINGKTLPFFYDMFLNSDLLFYSSPACLPKDNPLFLQPVVHVNLLQT